MIEEKTKAWGIAALVCGIMSIVLFMAPYFGLPLGILAMVFYGVQQKHIPTGQAVAGLVTGVIGTIISFVMAVLMLFMLVILK